jgi:hypothetical protein
LAADSVLCDRPLWVDFDFMEPLEARIGHDSGIACRLAKLDDFVPRDHPLQPAMDRN